MSLHQTLFTGMLCFVVGHLENCAPNVEGRMRVACIRLPLILPVSIADAY